MKAVSVGWAGPRSKALVDGDVQPRYVCERCQPQAVLCWYQEAASQQCRVPRYSPAVVCPSLSADVRPSGRPVGTARDPPLAKVSGTVAGLGLPWDVLIVDLALSRSIPSPGQSETPLFWQDLRVLGW